MCKTENPKSVNGHFEITAFLCACLVVFIHVPQLTPDFSWTWRVECFLSQGICRIAVPFFFISAGYFLSRHIGEKGWWPREISKRIHSLLVPYFFWTSLWALLWKVLVLLSNIHHGRLPMQNICFNLIPIYGLNFFENVSCVPLWFIRCLLVFVLCSPILFFPLRFGRPVVLITLTFLFLVYVCFSKLNPDEGTVFFLFRNTFSLEGMFYFLLGAVLQVYPVVLKKTLFIRRGCGAIGVFLLVIMVGLVENGYEVLASKIRFLAIPFLLLFIWLRLSSCELKTNLLRNTSFAIYLLHPWGIDVVQPVLGFFSIHFGVHLVLYFTTAFTAILGSILAKKVLDISFPKFSNVIFGGR